MRFFRNFPEFRNFPDLRGHSRGNPRSGLIFGGGGYHILCVLADRQQCWNGTTSSLQVFNLMTATRVNIQMTATHVNIHDWEVISNM